METNKIENIEVESKPESSGPGSNAGLYFIIGGSVLMFIFIIVKSYIDHH